MIKTKQIEISTQGFCDLINLTEEIEQFIREEKVIEGGILIFVQGSTAAITTIEYEPNLIKDFQELMEKIVPQNKDYHHNETWGDDNGFSHLRASLIGPSLFVPIKNGKPLLGTWQQIILCDFDNRPRERKIFLTIFK